MNSIKKSILFASSVTTLSLFSFPAFAQVQQIIRNSCGFFNCTGGETFLGAGNSLEWYIFQWVGPARPIWGLIALLAGIYLLVAAVMYIMSTGDEEKANRAKKQILYAMSGLVVAALAFIITSAVITRDTTTLVPEINIYINLALSLFSTLATIFLIYAGYKYITSTGDEEKAATAKRQILYALIGVFIAGIASIIVTAVTNTDSTTLLTNIRSVVNAVLALLSLAAAIYVIIGGVMYITSQGDEQKSSQAKTQIIYALLGVAVIAISALLVNLIIGAIP